MNRNKRSRFAIFCELWAANETVPAIAMRLKVSERTIVRYLRDLEGRTRKIDYYDKLRPLVLAHLGRYPTSWFTTVELGRVLGRNDATLHSTLRRMEGAGLIVREHRLHNSRGDKVKAPIRWWRLADENGQT
jgi:DNA-binding MarR family transcriptional regulator